MADHAYDVAVVGAGLVGAVAALTLGGTGRRVALIDREAPQARTGRLGFDTRTVALTGASLALLGNRVEAAAPIRRMKVWEECGTGAIEFDANAVGAQALAWVVEASPARTALWQACAECPNVECLIGDVVGLTEEITSVRLTFAERDRPGAAPPVSAPSTVSARLVIAADGASSKVCELAGVKALTRGEGDAAIATVVEMERPHEGVARQRFGANGPLALLPLPHPRTVSLIWSLDRDAAERLAALEDTQFADALEAASEGALGRVKDLDRRTLAPLAQHVVANCNPLQRLLVLGDAARTVHPLGRPRREPRLGRRGAGAKEGERRRGGLGARQPVAWLRRPSPAAQRRHGRLDEGALHRLRPARPGGALGAQRRRPLDRWNGGGETATHSGGHGHRSLGQAPLVLQWRSERPSMPCTNAPVA